MAKWDVENGSKNGQTVSFAPGDIVLPSQEMRGRHKPLEQSKVVERALSMLAVGQIQPVTVRKEGNKPLLVAGFTRHAAAMLIREGFQDGEGTFYKDENFLLTCIVSNCNDDKALDIAIQENLERNNTSPMDDAYNQDLLRERRKWPDTQIARYYKWSAVKVGQYKKLLSLSTEHQELVHSGEMSVAAALKLLAIPYERRRMAVDACIAEHGKIVGSYFEGLLLDLNLPKEEEYPEEETQEEFPETQTTLSGNSQESDKPSDNAISESPPPQIESKGETPPPETKGKGRPSGGSSGSIWRTKKDCEKLFKGLEKQLQKGNSDLPDQVHDIVKTIAMWLERKYSDKRLLDNITKSLGEYADSEKVPLSDDN